MHHNESHRWTPDEDGYILGNSGKMTFAEIGRRLGRLTKHHVRGRYLRLKARLAKQISGTPQIDGEPDVVCDGGQNDQSVTVNGVKADSQQGAMETALREAKVDLGVWEVARWKVKRYQGFYRDRSWQPDGSQSTHEWRRSARVVTMWSVQISLTRKKRNHTIDSVDAALKRLEERAPTYPKPVRRSSSAPPHMLEIALYDAHFGKLAWAAETGESYDLKIAERLFQNAVVDLLQKASPWNIETILLPIGQDFLHVNNAINTTANGTQQDVDDRLFKVYETGVKAVVKAVEQCLVVSPVQILWVPGNHDRETSHFLVREIKAWFHRCADVTVDIRPTLRKIVTYGANGIMFSHGDQEARRDLPAIMASEDREAWGKTKYNEIHLGHFHKKRETYFDTADTHGGGVVVRTLPSLSSADAWHYAKGWGKTPRAAEAYLWGRTPGLQAYLNSPVAAAA